MPRIFDPALAAASPDMDAVRAMYEGLTDYGGLDLKPVPGVASRWNSSPDFREWTFHLRPDARWSNGDQVTAEDFVRSWQRAVQLVGNAPHAKLLDDFRSSTAANNHAPSNLANNELLTKTTPSPQPPTNQIVAVKPTATAVPTIKPATNPTAGLTVKPTPDQTLNQASIRRLMRQISKLDLVPKRLMRAPCACVWRILIQTFRRSSRTRFSVRFTAARRWQHRNLLSSFCPRPVVTLI